MSLFREDQKDRKDQILSITIQEYIKTVTPVSSQLIVRRYPVDLSSATVRNILAELEEEGLLTHPHTSAGRIPTQRGYRYYVDHLMDEIQLLEEEKKTIKAQYIKESKELETLLEKTSQVLSDMTHYTTIVSVDGPENKIFCRGLSFAVSYPELPDVKKIQTIIAALEEKEQILEMINQNLAKRIEIFIGQELTDLGVDSCSLAVSRYETKSGPSGRIAVLGPTRMDYQRVVSALEYCSGLMKEIF